MRPGAPSTTGAAFSATEDAPQPFADAPNAVSDASNAGSDAPKPVFDVPNPVFDAPNLDFDVPNPVFDAPNLDFDAPNPVFDAPNPVFDAPNPVFDAPNPVFDAPNPVFDAPNPVFDVPNLDFDVPNLDFDVPNLVFDAPNLVFDASNSVFDARFRTFRVVRPGLDSPDDGSEAFARPPLACRQRRSAPNRRSNRSDMSERSERSVSSGLHEVGGRASARARRTDPTSPIHRAERRPRAAPPASASRPGPRSIPSGQRPTNDPAKRSRVAAAGLDRATGGTRGEEPTMSFLVRWGLIGLGGFLVFGGVNEAINGDRVSEEAAALSPAEAARLAGRSAPSYVSVPGELDLDRTIFETAIREPAMTAMPSDEVYRLPMPGTPGWSGAPTYLGSTVTLDAPLHPSHVIVETIEMDAGESLEEGELRSIRCIGTAMTAAGQVFVLSPSFRSQDDPDYLAWTASTSFWGSLCRIDQLDENVSFERPIGEVIDLFRSNGVPASGAALCVIAREGSPYPHDGAAYAPLVGSNDAVLVRFRASELDALGSSIDGIAESAYASYLPGANRLIDGLPNRLVILDTSRTGADVNASTSNAALLGCVLGLVFMGLGGGWVYSIRAGRAHQQRVAETHLEAMLSSKYGVDPAAIEAAHGNTEAELIEDLDALKVDPMIDLESDDRRFAA